MMPAVDRCISKYVCQAANMHLSLVRADEEKEGVTLLCTASCAEPSRTTREQSADTSAAEAAQHRNSACHRYPPCGLTGIDRCLLVVSRVIGSPASLHFPLTPTPTFRDSAQLPPHPPTTAPNPPHTPALALSPYSRSCEAILIRLIDKQSIC